MRARPQAELERAVETVRPPRDLGAALRPPPGGVRLIAEIKRASPSRGVLATSFAPLALALTYARHGAAAVSVVTDEPFFQGSLDHLAVVASGVNVPVLRKDFIIDEYQLWEARAAGADAALLIVGILDLPQLESLLRAAKRIGLSALVETHTRAELETAGAAGAQIVGINNRDLTTFETTLETTLALIPHAHPGALIVSESGFFVAADVRRVVDAGAHAVLVGEALVKADDLPGKLRELSLAQS